jgi:hypothetical protein
MPWPSSQAGPDRNVGVLQPARDEAGDALGGVVQLGGDGGHLVHRLGILDTLRGEDFLVVVDHPVIDEERDRIERAVGLRA